MPELVVIVATGVMVVAHQDLPLHQLPHLPQGQQLLPLLVMLGLWYSSGLRLNLARMSSSEVELTITRDQVLNSSNNNFQE